MIRLEVEDYCHSCLDFSPDVTKAERYYGDGEPLLSDTIVKCEYRKRCNGIRRYLEKSMKDKESQHD